MSDKPKERTIESMLGKILERCEAGDVQRARQYFAKNPGNGMDDCARWMESLCRTCADMLTSPALGNELDTFCEHSLADVPRLRKIAHKYNCFLGALQLTAAAGGIVEPQEMLETVKSAAEEVLRILSGEEPDDG